MTHDTSALAATLLANFRTIRFPPTEEYFPRSPAHWDWWQAAKARRADRRAVFDYRQRLRCELVEHGHRHFLDYVEPDPDGGWRLHLFVTDDAAMLLLDEITEGRCGAGDPARFDPKEFVLAQLEEQRGCAKDATNDAADMQAETIHIPFPIKRRAVDLYWQLLKTLLSQGGHEVILDRIEPDPDDGWQIHFLCRDPATITLLHNVAVKGCCAGDPLALLAS
jgi:hypothetical protein